MSQTAHLFYTLPAVLALITLLLDSFRDNIPVSYVLISALICCIPYVNIWIVVDYTFTHLGVDD